MSRPCVLISGANRSVGLEEVKPYFENDRKVIAAFQPKSKELEELL